MAAAIFRASCRDGRNVAHIERKKDRRGKEKEKQLLACTIANLFDCSRGRFVPWRWQLSRDDTALDDKAMKVKYFAENCFRNESLQFPASRQRRNRLRNAQR